MTTQRLQSQAKSGGDKTVTLYDRWKGNCSAEVDLDSLCMDFIRNSLFQKNWHHKPSWFFSNILVAKRSFAENQIIHCKGTTMACLLRSEIPCLGSCTSAHGNATSQPVLCFYSFFFLKEEKHYPLLMLKVCRGQELSGRIVSTSPPLACKAGKARIISSS